MQLTGLDLLFWAGGFFAHLSLFCILLIRRRYLAFPVFSILIAANLIRTITLYFVHASGSKTAYFVIFWTLAAVDTGLQLGVVYEMYFNTFRPLGTWARDVRHASVWLLAFGVLTAGSLSWLAAPATRLWIQAFVIRGSLFSSVWIGELLVGMICLSVNSGLPWRTHVARISIGLGAYSLCDVVIEAAHSYFGIRGSSQLYVDLSHVRMCVYLCCVILWIVSLWRDAPPSEQLSTALQEEMEILQKKVAYDLQRIRIRR